MLLLLLKLVSNMYQVIYNLLPEVVYIGNESIYDFYYIKNHKRKNFLKIGMLQNMFDYRSVNHVFKEYENILLCQVNGKDITKKFYPLSYYYNHDVNINEYLSINKEDDMKIYYLEDI